MAPLGNLARTGKQGQINGTYILCLGSNDVLLGRGTPANEHIGNVRFRFLIDSLKPKYLATSRRSEKQSIASDVIDIISRREGRFVRRVDPLTEAGELGVPAGKPAWVIVDGETALTKVKQALRDREKQCQVDQATKATRKPQCGAESNSKSGEIVGLVRLAESIPHLCVAQGNGSFVSNPRMQHGFALERNDAKAKNLEEPLTSILASSSGHQGPATKVEATAIRSHVKLLEEERISLSILCSHGIPLCKDHASARGPFYFPASTEGEAGRMQFTWADFALLLRRDVAGLPAPATGSLTRYCLDAKSLNQVHDGMSDSGQLNPVDTARKTLMLLEKIRLFGSAPSTSVAPSDDVTTQDQMEKVLQSWLQEEITKWAKSLRIVDVDGLPFAVSSTDMLDKEFFDSNRLTCLDGESCRSVVYQVARMSRLRLYFETSRETLPMVEGREMSMGTTSAPAFH